MPDQNCNPNPLDINPSVRHFVQCKGRPVMLWADGDHDFEANQRCFIETAHQLAQKSIPRFIRLCQDTQPSNWKMVDSLPTAPLHKPLPAAIAQVASLEGMRVFSDVGGFADGLIVGKYAKHKNPGERSEYPIDVVFNTNELHSLIYEAAYLLCCYMPPGMFGHLRYRHDETVTYEFLRGGGR